MFLLGVSVQNLWATTSCGQASTKHQHMTLLETTLVLLRWVMNSSLDPTSYQYNHETYFCRDPETIGFGGLDGPRGRPELKWVPEKSVHDYINTKLGLFGSYLCSLDENPHRHAYLEGWRLVVQVTKSRAGPA